MSNTTEVVIGYGKIKKKIRWVAEMDSCGWFIQRERIQLYEEFMKDWNKNGSL